MVGLVDNVPEIEDLPPGRRDASPVGDVIHVVSRFSRQVWGFVTE
jgi:hypothetical protein